MHTPNKFSGPRARYLRLCTSAPPAVVAVLVAAAPRLALALDHELCVKWRVDAIDRTTGTLTETAALQWPARGARVRVSFSGGGLITITRTSTTDGCFTFQTFDSPGTPPPPDVLRDVRVYYDTRVGTPSMGQTAGRVQVRGFFDQTQDNANTDTSVLIQNVWFSRFSDGVYRSSVNVGSGVDPMSISMASVSHTLHRVDTAMTGNKPTTPPLLKVILQPCGYSNTSNWSCLDADDGKLFLTPDPDNGSTARKFVSGHETGHWLDYHWGGTSGTFASTGGNSDYTFAAGQQSTLEETCRFTWASIGGQGNQAHAMRSQEYQHAAVREAFAHFMALYSFNADSATTNPGFLYYKTQTASSVDGSYPANDKYFGAGEFNIPSFIYTPFSFLDSSSGCDCTALGNCDGTSTEMQWMRAYWWYLLRDEPGVTKPTLTDFFGQMQSVPKASGGVTCHSNTDKCFGAVSSVLSGAFLTRWQSVGATMGLATDNP